jgi:steroid delta-isomerase-like uncharacterized protein
MSIAENARLDDEFIAAWDTHDPERALAILSDDVVWKDAGVPQPINGKAGARAQMQGWFQAFPNLTTVYRNHVVTEDQVAAEVQWTGTNTGAMQMAPGAPALPPTGKSVRGQGTYFLRIRNGQVAEVHSYPDAMGLMVQLGLVPGA